MKKIILLLVSIVMICPSVTSQDVLGHKNIENNRSKTIEERRIQPYPKLRDADLMWSRKIWREIDLREKINHPFYYPAVEPGNEKVLDRRSLIDVILDGIREGVVTAFADAALDDEFKQPMTQQEIEELFVTKTLQEVPDFELRNTEDMTIWDPNAMKMEEISDSLNPTLVKKWRMKEIWYFDKKRSVMDVRIIGLCPLAEVLDEDGNPTGVEEPLFWVLYEDAKVVLAHAEIFNLMKNDAERRTYHDIFWKRMFSSKIVEQSNVFDRKIDQYMIGLDAVLKSEEIKAELFNLEHDLWEY